MANMAKKIFSIVVAAIAAAALCVTAMASTHGSVDIDKQAKYWRSFKAETEYPAGANEIYAGIQCLRVDTGTAASENWLESAEAKDGVLVTYVEATVSVSYASYPMLVRAFSSHTAYKNGQQLFEEYNESGAF